ncbi:LysM peptidoglycan-binding domain-containing protein [Oscillibacter sp. MSJ-2]|uniref:LysM peptidoglycan-binding domain-containing protein n=1 Tax=Dysosmobacter acutus TaxID=2841504 RepID=A0ABS6F6Q0_9FIRM|nr:LysM peptidoglycan-binding domain-containing protein [Dysosmobacter acutus]MBU5625958.1 LysM peptidoglycan-binding domain-containing protein [Dysosmobacter acutus]
MKKFITLFLALALSMGLAVPALAAETDQKIAVGDQTYERVLQAILSQTEDQPVSLRLESDILMTAPVVIGSSDYDGLFGGIVITVPSHDIAIDLNGFALTGPESGPIFTVQNGYTLTVLDSSDAQTGKLVSQSEKPVIEEEGGIYVPVRSTAPTESTTPTESTAPAVPDAPSSYTVKKGDTWGTICINFYGSNAQRCALQKANKYVKLTAGTVITLPEKLGKAVLIPAPVAGEGETLYTIKYGDSLGSIAKAAYGDMMKYKAIFERNSDRLKNANTIYEGQVIVLPAK